MKVSAPPRVASFILERLGPPNEPLRGDLLEEYRAGRSRWWYWRQALAAVAGGAATDLWRNKSLALRAIPMAIGFQTLIAMLLEPAWEHWLSGWVFALTRGYDFTESATPLVQWAHIAFWFPGFVCVGWLLARSLPEHRAAALVSVVGFGLLWCVPEIVRLVSAGLEHSRFPDALPGYIVGVVSYATGVVAGAMLSAPHRPAI